MNISRKLITLGLALSLLGSTSAFARPTPHFENGFLSYEENTVESPVPAARVPAARTSGAIGYAGRPSANTVKDDWPNNMLLD